MREFVRFLLDPDLLRLFSNLLAGLLWVYFAVVTIQSLWWWVAWLAGKDKYTSILRRYLVVHGLRLRLRSFVGDIVICILLCVAFFLIWTAQWKMYQIEDAVKKARQMDRNAVRVALSEFR